MAPTTAIKRRIERCGARCVEPWGPIGLGSPSAFLIVVLGTFVVRGADEKSLSQTAATGNEAGIQLIQNYYCKVLYKVSAKASTGEQTAEYWRNGPRSFRIREATGPGLTTDVLGADGRVRIVTTSSSSPRIAASSELLIDEANRKTVDTDAWQLSLFRLPVMVSRKPSFIVYSLSEAISKGSVETAEWVKLDDRRCLHLLIRLKEEGRSYEVWVDPGYNWLITRCIHRIYMPDGSEFWNTEHRSLDVREIKPSIFVPTKSAIATKMKDRLVGEGEVVFSQIRINDATASPPPFVYPAGSVAVDEVDGAAYQIDRNGKRAGRPARLGEPRTASFETPEIEEPEFPSSRMAGWSCMGLALILAGLALRRRSRRIESGRRRNASRSPADS